LSYIPTCRNYTICEGYLLRYYLLTPFPVSPSP